MCQALGMQQCGKGTEEGHAVMELLLDFVVILPPHVPVPLIKNKEALGHCGRCSRSSGMVHSRAWAWASCF